MIGPSLEEVLTNAVQAQLQSVWTALPGRVLAWDGGTATVQPLPAVLQDEEAQPIPVLHGVPIAYPAGGGCSITFPLQVGDYVIVLFSTLPLARFRQDGAEGDPEETRRFDLSDAWCIPVAGGLPPAAVAGKCVLRPPTGGKVYIGGDTLTEPAVKGTTLRAELDVLWALLQAHVHPGVAVGPGVTGPSAILAVPNPVGAACLAGKVEVV